MVCRSDNVERVPMTDRIHLMTSLASIAMIAAGLWQISVSAALIGVGSLLLALVIATRLLKDRQHGRSDEPV